MNSLLNRPMAPARRRGQSSHQNAAHRLLVGEGYEFDRLDGNQHNHYRNAHGQEIVAVCSPKNSSEGLNRLRNTIRSQKRQREEAHVPTRTITKTPDLADKLIAMADPFLLKPLREEDHFKSPAARAKRQAYVGWLKRAYEKHGPLPADAIEVATERLGFAHGMVAKARKELGVVAFREGSHGKPGGGLWYSCLPWQLPEGKKASNQAADASLGVEVEAVTMSGTQSDVPMPAPVLRDSAENPLHPGRKPEPQPDQDGTFPSLALPNGKPALSDQQAAAFMLLESLGIKAPGEEAKLALQKAAEALDDAHAALSNAMQALA